MKLAKSIVLVAVLGLLAGACGGKSKRPPVVNQTPDGTGSTSTTRPGDRGGQTTDLGPDVRTLGEDGAASTDFGVSDPSTGEGGPLDDIRFDYDKATLSEEAKGILERHALWLKQHAAAKVTIEGHCDERGTAEYNLALGDQRAKATRDYLVSLGLRADRLRTVSFGKEKPLDPSGSEAAFARNRRAHFAVSR
jgi:peptidoglycan-associated lipoprotein